MRWIQPDKLLDLSGKLKTGNDMPDQIEMYAKKMA